MNKVIIEYLIKGEDNFCTSTIRFEDYFDLEINERPEINSVPKHSQPFQYLNIEVKKIVLLKLYFEIDNEKRVFNQTFWNEGNNFLTERIDAGIENYREITLSFKLHNKKDIYEVLRLDLNTKFIIPTYHGLFHVEEDGKEIEEKFDTNIFLDIIKKKTGR